MSYFVINEDLGTDVRRSAVSTPIGQPYTTDWPAHADYAAYNADDLAFAPNVPPAAGADTNDLASQTGADAVITVAGVAGRAWYLGGLTASYSATPTGGRLTVYEEDTAGSNTFGRVVFDETISAAQPAPFTFNPVLKFAAGKAFKVTLTSGGGTIVGKVSLTGKNLGQV